jgi:hypothetical protein
MGLVSTTNPARDLAIANSIVVDYGPLLTYLGLLYLDQRGASKATRGLFFGDLRPGATFSETEQERLRKKMDGFQILTTPHVLVETFNVRMPSRLARELAFRPFCVEVLGTGRIKEVPCPIREIVQEQRFQQLICRLGLTDAGLVFIASRYGALLLTDDGPLSKDYSAGADYRISLLTDWL